jgi:aryl-alcohol dehydrogenase-like predicted oxidoreductase
MQAFSDIVRQGKALYIGVSEWNAEQIRAGHKLSKELGFQLISSQPQYSALWRVIEAEVVPTCKELGVSQIVWSPMAQGVLTGKYKPGQPAPEGSRGSDERLGGMMGKYLSDEVLSRVQQLEPLAQALNLTMAQFALAWVLQNDNVASAIVGATKPEQISSNIEAVGVEIPADVMKQVSEILAPVAVFDPRETKSPEARLV